MKILAKQRLMSTKLSRSRQKELQQEFAKHIPILEQYSENLAGRFGFVYPTLIQNKVIKSLKSLGWVLSSADAHYQRYVYTKDKVWPVEVVVTSQECTMYMPIDDLIDYGKELVKKAKEVLKDFSISNGEAKQVRSFDSPEDAKERWETEVRKLENNKFKILRTVDKKKNIRSFGVKATHLSTELKYGLFFAKVDLFYNGAKSTVTTYLSMLNGEPDEEFKSVYH